MIHYADLTEDDIGKLTRLLLIMHQESPVYSEFEPDIQYGVNLVKYIIDNDQFRKVVFDDDEMVGVMLGFVANIPFVQQKAANEAILYVHPRHRNGRIGPKLIREFEAWAIEAGIPFINAGVSAEINSAIANGLYQRLGYTPSGSNFRKHLN